MGAWFENAYSATVVFVLIGTIAVTVSAYEKTFAETKKAQRNRQVGIVIGACVLILALGVFRYGQANLNQSVLTEFVRSTGSGQATKGIPVITRGFVDNEMSVKDDKAQLIFHVTELEVPGRVIMVDERTLIFLKAYPTYQIGDLLSVQGALQLPDNFAPDFDYVQYLKNKDIRTTISYPKISFESTIRLSWPQQLKIGIYKKSLPLKIVFNHLSLVLCPRLIRLILTGYYWEQDKIFRLISPMRLIKQARLIFSLFPDIILRSLPTLFWGFGLFMRRRRAFWVSVAVIILFTIMTGAGASVVRAAIMGLLLLFANGYGRMYDPKNSILLAAGVMIFLDPLALRFDVGFQLSFLAVLGLMYIGPILKEKFKKDSRTV